MSRERNRTHKKNRIKKEVQFFNSKAAFVAGFAVIMVTVNDIIGLCSKIPMWVNAVELIGIILLYIFALCTKKMDGLLSKKGADNFGSSLTIISIVEFLLGRALISTVEDVEFACELSNAKMQVVIILSLFAVVSIGGAIFLLFCKYPKK